MIEIVHHYAREAGLTTAREFRGEAEGTFQRLARMLGMGGGTSTSTRPWPIGRLTWYRGWAALQ